MRVNAARTWRVVTVACSVSGCIVPRSTEEDVTGPKYVACKLRSLQVQRQGGSTWRGQEYREAAVEVLRGGKATESRSIRFVRPDVAVVFARCTSH